MQIRWSIGADCNSHITKIKSPGGEVGSLVGLSLVRFAFVPVPNGFAAKDGALVEGSRDSGLAKTGSISVSIDIEFFVLGELPLIPLLVGDTTLFDESLLESGVGEGGSSCEELEEELEVENDRSLLLLLTPADTGSRASRGIRDGESFADGLLFPSLLLSFPALPEVEVGWQDEEEDRPECD